jgi:hypothetical protein
VYPRGPVPDDHVDFISCDCCQLVVCRSIDDPGSEQAGAARRFLATDSDHITKSATDH